MSIQNAPRMHIARKSAEPSGIGGDELFTPCCWRSQSVELVRDLSFSPERVRHAGFAFMERSWTR